ncbi:MAG: adenylate kinase [Limnoraphis robusta]|uniref:Adenylate kinase n=1 Tax=Limnoraphis robusta CS-951 TaxID=1637645 RepID=A0A0F5YHY5_9CYAN|nr:adenylate kinase [Limnoraphis robusta]KKD37805.1 adenylate kinase [Limnoraphis robusta CS-951]
MRLVILGGPGAGKGTQAEGISQHLDIPSISTGEVLRNAIADQTNLGEKARPYVEKGELVPDDIMIQFIRQRLLQLDVSQGWLLDGYPRTAFQAEELDFLLEDLGQQLNWTIYLNVPEDELMKRSLQRSRSDDQPEIIQRRIEVFYQRTIPILEYYSPRDRLLDINGNQPPEQVQQEIFSQLRRSTTSET